MVRSRLPAIALAIPRVVETAIENGAGQVAQDAKARVPDAPPLGKGLVDAIHTKAAHDGWYVIAGDDDHFYGHMVEHGTTHSAPHPFLVPALEENVNDILRMARGGLKGLE